MFCPIFQKKSVRTRDFLGLLLDPKSFVGKNFRTAGGSLRMGQNPLSSPRSEYPDAAPTCDTQLKCKQPVAYIWVPPVFATSLVSVVPIPFWREFLHSIRPECVC